MIRQANQEFAKVSTYLPPSPIQQVLCGLVLVMADADHYRRTRTPHFETTVITRSMYVREVLMLPEILDTSELELCTYQMSRMCCLLSLQAWIYPDSGPNHTWTRNLPRRLIHMLQPVLDRSLAVMLHEKLPEFYMWTVILGLMLAYEDFDNTGNGTAMRLMVTYLDTLSVKPKPAAWATIRCVVAKFLWCEEDCAETAREAWQLACQMYTVATPSVPSMCNDSPLSTSTATAVGTVSSDQSLDLKAIRSYLENGVRESFDPILLTERLGRSR